MDTWFKLLSVVFVGLGACHFRTTSAESNSSTPHNKDVDDKDGQKNLTIAWIEKPPYATEPNNGSLDNEAGGIVRDALLRYMTWDCGIAAGSHYRIRTLRTDSEIGMIELLKQNKVHIAVPIFEQQNNPQYTGFIFFKLDDYPGTEYITVTDDETNALDVVLDAVLKSWPLLAVTLTFTAIAGIIIWALVRLKSCHSYCRIPRVTMFHGESSYM